MVWPNKFISVKGVDEGEYADAGTTENLPGLGVPRAINDRVGRGELRGRVQGTAEKGLGAAGPNGASPHAGGAERAKPAFET